MMKQRLLLLNLLLISTLFSCQKPIEEPIQQHQTPITFQLIPDPQSRATERQFEVGDEAGVYAYYNGKEVHADNVKVVYNGTHWIPSTPIYWVSCRNLSFYLYYPYDLTHNGAFFSIHDNQTDQSNYNNSTYISAFTSSIAESTAPVTMQFSHKMSSIEFRFEAGKGITENELSLFTRAVTLDNIKTSCRIDTKIGLTSYPSTEMSVRTFKQTDGTFRAYIVPQIISSVQKWINIETSAGDFSFDSPEIVFNSGERLVATFNVSRNPNNQIELAFNGFDKLRAEQKTFTVIGIQNFVEIPIQSSVDYRVEVGKNAENWLSISPQSKAVTASNIRINIQTNTTGEQRQGLVYLHYANLSDSIKIIQTLPDLLHIFTEGTLFARLLELNLKMTSCLTVTGSIDKRDIASLNYISFYNLIAIDLSGTNLTELNTSAFDNCKKLQYIVLPNPLKTIQNNAFNNCYSLTTISLPSSITSIGSSVFSNCDALTTFVCNAPIPPTLDANAFDNTRSDKTLFVPASSLDSYKSSTYWKQAFSDGAAIKPL